MVIVGTMYFYIILHDLMCVNFGHNWLKYDTLKKKFIKALLRVL